MIRLIFYVFTVLNFFYTTANPVTRQADFYEAVPKTLLEFVPPNLLEELYPERCPEPAEGESFQEHSELAKPLSRGSKKHEQKGIPLVLFIVLRPRPSAWLRVNLVFSELLHE